MRALRRPTISTCLFLLFTLLATFTITVRADDDNDRDEYEESARVARVSMIRGDVQLQRNTSKTWERARVNFPLVEGDTLATTGQDARLEIQIDARNFVRVGGDSILRVVSLRDEGVALSLSEGVATIRLARFDRNKEYFEIDAPGTTLAAEKRGVYRLDVSQTGSVRLFVRDGGQARIYSETSGFTLRDGRSAELINNGTDAGDWELSRAESLDSWDRWVDERERYLSARLHYDGRDRYYDSDVWGAEELDAYGDWVYVNDYGWVWRPYSTATNNYSNWAPYRYGHWVWCPPYGWTWVGDEAWGWAPYHYGRWVYYNDSWCWAPRGLGYAAHRSWWRPALVVFAYVPTSYGERVCWYPLTYGQRDPRGRHYRRLEALRSNDVARLGRTNPAYLRAITSLPARDFGRQSAQTQQAPTEIARRAILAEPVRGRLPIQPADGSGTNAGVGEGRAPRGIAPARPPNSTGVVGTLSDRSTGAATRTPGVALDGELRRTRLYNGRELRPLSGASENNGGNGGGNNTGGNAGVVDPGNTGVVARPARVRSTDRQPIERGTQGNGGDSSTPWYERPVRPARVNSGEGRGQSSPTPSPTIERPDGGDAGTAPAPAPRVRPVSPQRGDGNDGGEPAARPARRPEARPEPRTEPRPESQPENRPESRPEPRYERPEPRVEPRPESRPEPRYERPEPRSEPRPESRPEPRPESRPEPRQEPRQEPRPESRPEPPPQREQPKSEEPKAAPPQRERGDDAPARPSKSRDNR